MPTPSSYRPPTLSPTVSPNLWGTPAPPGSWSNCRSEPDHDASTQVPNTYTHRIEDRRVRFTVDFASVGGPRTPDEWEKRLRIVRRFALRAYRAVCLHLGEDGARRLFNSLASPDPVRRGRKRGSRDKRRDDELIARYDAAASELTSEVDLKSLPMRLAIVLYDESRKSDAPRKFGNSAQAIDKHIRRLLVQRRRLENLKKARARRLRESLSPSAPTLLSLTLGAGRTANRVNKVFSPRRNHMPDRSPFSAFEEECEQWHTKTTIC